MDSPRLVYAPMHVVCQDRPICKGKPHMRVVSTRLHWQPAATE